MNFTKIFSFFILIFPLNSCAYPLQNIPDENEITLYAPITIPKENFENVPFYLQSFLTEYPNSFLSPIALEEVRQYYHDRQYAPIWYNKHGPLEKTFSIHHALSTELYYTTLSKEPDMIKFSQKKPIDIARKDLEITMHFLKKTRYIGRGVSNIQGRYGVTETPFPHSFSPSHILKIFEDNNIQSLLRKIRPIHPLYDPLVTEIKKLSLLKKEAMPKVRSSNDIKSATIILQKYGFLSPDYLLPLNNKKTFNDALMAFQKSRAIQPSKKINHKTISALNTPINKLMKTLLLNIERIRKTPVEESNHPIRVNIPSYEMVYYTPSDHTKHTMPVIVGKTKRPTPIFSDKISYIDVNPSWYIPPTIAREDILPKVKRNISYLKRKNIEIFKGNKKLDPRKISWKNVNKNNIQFHFRQKAGKSNALGRVKFMFPNKHAVYLHDTPHKAPFKNKLRARSSGCIRVQNAILLTHDLLQSQRAPQNISRLFKHTNNKQIRLHKKIPVSLEYLTIGYDKNHLQYYKDIYKYDAGLFKVIKNNPVKY